LTFFLRFDINKKHFFLPSDQSQGYNVGGWFVKSDFFAVARKRK
jgi:hypothetical protein